MGPNQDSIDDAKVGGPHAVANIQGVPVYTEGAIPAGAAADTIYCGRTGDMWLYESEAMMQTSVNSLGGTLTVRLTYHRYVAFVGNIYTTALARVNAIQQPTAF